MRLMITTFLLHALLECAAEVPAYRRNNPWLSVNRGAPCTVITSRAYSCVRSGNFPNKYGRNERCNISVLRPGAATARPFRTMNGTDILTIGKQQFSGTTEFGPHHVIVDRLTSIRWASSNTTMGDRGFEMCVGHELSNGFLPGVNSHCTIGWHKNMISPADPCVNSRNFPNNYGNRDQCFIEIEKPGYVYTVGVFDTKKLKDVLTIDGVSFSGKDGPRNVKVVAGSKVRWKVDDVGAHHGWQICMASKAMSPSSTGKPPAAAETHKPAPTKKLAADTKASRLFTVTVINSTIQGFAIDLKMLTAGSVSIACLVQPSTSSFSGDLFDHANNVEIKETLIFDHMPARFGILKFDKTVDGARFSASQYRLSCLGRSQTDTTLEQLFTHIVTLEETSSGSEGSKISNVQSSGGFGVYFRTLNSWTGYLIWIPLAIAIILCVACKAMKAWRGTPSVRSNDIETPKPVLSVRDGYIPPTLVGDSGIII
eukprot:GEMP01027000.1.p1 GENE.GEMP01027000.1~~GEMP01027000.1.p1  ORF type:complete len:483 (+),score=69.60 GEMP01027000.1:264-1712(+)